MFLRAVCFPLFVVWAAMMWFGVGGVCVAGEVDPFSEEALLRSPLVTITPLAGPVRLDGVVTSEWGRSTILQDFVRLDSGADHGFVPAEETTVRVSYNREAMWIGFVIGMGDQREPVVADGEGTAPGEGDAFEIVLQPGETDAAAFVLRGDAAGRAWMRLAGGEETSWSVAGSGIVYHAAIDANRGEWSGEWKIPWEVFGVEMPEEGALWRANFLTLRRTPGTHTDAWSYWSGAEDFDRNGRIVFGGERAYFSMVRPLRDAWDGRRAAWPAMNNPLGEEHPRRVEGWVRLYRKKDGMPATSFLADLQARRAQAEGEAATFAPYARDVADVLGSYELISNQRATSPLPNPQFTGGWAPGVRVDRPGVYFAAWIHRDVTDEEAPVLIAGGGVPFHIRSGVQAEVFPYLLTRGSVVLAADLRGVEARDSARKIRGVVTGEGGMEVLAENTTDYEGGLQQEIEVSVEGLPVGGEYEARFQVLDGEGRVLSEDAVPFSRPPDPDWWVHREEWGSQPEVPKPWSPVAWSDGVAEVWGRMLVFNREPLPVSIVNQGTEMLAAPVALELKTGGKLQPWKEISAEVTEERPSQVVLETVREAGGVRVSTRTQVEFDGFMLVDLEIRPVDGEAEIDLLDLVIPVKADCAEFLTNYRNAPGPGAPVQRYSGKTPEYHVGPVMLTTWLGTGSIGLEWSCESSRDWYLSDPDRAVEVRNDGKVVEARFHLIDGPMKLGRPRNIRFGLIPTPTKFVPPEWRVLRVDRAPGLPPIPGRTRVQRGREFDTATAEDLEEYRKRNRDADILVCLLPINWSGYDAWHPPVQDPQIAETVREHNRLAAEEGQIICWNGGWGVSQHAPEWDPWGKEMVSRPIEPTFADQYIGSYASPYVEFLVGAWRSHFRDLGIRGIRFDTVVPWKISSNPYLGETWTDDHGETHGTQNLFRQRELMKRIVREFQQQTGEPGIVYLPLAGPPVMTVESFSDIREIGEGFYMKAGSVKEAYPQDMMRPWMTAGAYGVLESNSLKGEPLRAINRIGPLLVMDASPRMSARPGMNATTYTPRGHDQVPASRIWEAWTWIDRGAASWHPHWDNAELIGTSGDGEHYVSFHLQEGRRMLLAAANYEAHPQTITVRMDASALGFSADTRLIAVDAVTGEELAIENNTLVLDILPELFRLVRIGSAEEMHFGETTETL